MREGFAQMPSERFAQKQQDDGFSWPVLKQRRRKRIREFPDQTSVAVNMQLFCKQSTDWWFTGGATRPSLVWLLRNRSFMSSAYSQEFDKIDSRCVNQAYFWQVHLNGETLRIVCLRYMPYTFGLDVYRFQTSTKQTSTERYWFNYQGAVLCNKLELSRNVVQVMRKNMSFFVQAIFWQVNIFWIYNWSNECTGLTGFMWISSQPWLLCSEVPASPIRVLIHIAMK